MTISIVREKLAKGEPVSAEEMDNELRMWMDRCLLLEEALHWHKMHTYRVNQRLQMMIGHFASISQLTEDKGPVIPPLPLTVSPERAENIESMLYGEAYCLVDRKDLPPGTKKVDLFQ